MNRVLGAVVFSILSSTAVALAAQVSASKQQNGDKGHGNELLRCIYTPQADTQSSSLPTTRMGFKFSVERNNNNEVAADTYTLNESSQPSATVESVTTFTGVTYTQIPVDCRLAPSGQGGGAEAKQPAAGN